VDLLTNVIGVIEKRYGRLLPQLVRSIKIFESNKERILEAIHAGPHLR
jgi:hypothetical protein